MPPSSLLPSFRRQQLLLEFAALKHQCPEGVYVSLNPKDPSSWSGVCFVRKGEYAPAVLRFELLFPPSYPDAPPLVTFSTEIFHPLLVPLTTYTFSGGAADPSATYSASESDRLPPGSLNLKYGFPDWRPTPERGRRSVRQVESEGTSTGDAGDVLTEQDGRRLFGLGSVMKSPILRILEYLKTAFDDPVFLDNLPLEAAGNPSAWHAWRYFRSLSQPDALRSSSPTTSASPVRTGGTSRNPADWNWDGVWEARVRTGIEESISDALLFDSKNVRSLTSSAEPIRFAKYDDEKLEQIQKAILTAQGFGTDLTMMT